MTRLLIILMLILAGACGRTNPGPAIAPASGAVKRIVSLDFCADQFVLKFVDRKNIAALSPDARKIFSYMREEAEGLPAVRPRAEDILLLQPDVVVRSYGGGPNIANFLARSGIEVVQIGYSADLAAVKQSILDTSIALEAPEKGRAVVANMERRLAAIPDRAAQASTLYLTSKGAVAGRETMVDEMLQKAQLQNFQTRPGWGFIALENLAYGSPEIVAASFFDTSDIVSDIWTPARHPLVKRRLAGSKVINLPSAWTACSAWPLIDAVEALAGATTP